MAKTTKKAKSVSKATRRKPAPVAVEATAELDWDALKRERAESEARTVALIAERDKQVEAMIVGSGRNAVHAELAPLHDALSMVCVWSGALVQSIAELPVPQEPGSELAHLVFELFTAPRRARWMEQWSNEYKSWWDAIKAARALAGTPIVAAIMDGGEQRPARKWTSQTVADLDRLAATLHPSREGGSGLGFFRAGAESLPANFTARADAIAARVVELQSVPQSSAAAPDGDDGDASPPALDNSDCIVLHALKKLGTDRTHSAQRIAEWLRVHKPADHRTPRTVSSAVQNLVRVGYAERPRGKKGGARLTMKGLRVKDYCD